MMNLCSAPTNCNLYFIKHEKWRLFLHLRGRSNGDTKYNNDQHSFLTAAITDPYSIQRSFQQFIRQVIVTSRDPCWWQITTGGPE